MTTSQNPKSVRLGIDIGSTTVKIACIGAENELLFGDYKRHHAEIRRTLHTLLKEARHEIGDVDVLPVITGSGGLSKCA